MPACQERTGDAPDNMVNDTPDTIDDTNVAHGQDSTQSNFDEEKSTYLDHDGDRLSPEEVNRLLRMQ